MHSLQRRAPFPALFREGVSRGALTWACAAGLFSLYWIYSLSVSRLVVPPTVDRPVQNADHRRPSRPPLTNLQIAKRYLPHVKWAGDAMYQMRTANSFVYAEDWQNVGSENAVRFKPFAMVWMKKGAEPGEQPITIVSDSAYVRFARKFDVTKPNPGRVIGGALEGKVELHGPNGMHVVGRNFVFSEKAMQMWSDAPVRFQHGLHTGRGHGLQCELLGPKTPPQGDRFAVNGIRSIRLRRNVVMDFVFQPGSKSGNPFRRKSAESKDGPVKDRKPVPVHVQSDGSFEFDTQTNVATFEDNVQVTRPTKPGLHDTLLCDLLTLVFEPEKPTGDATAKTGSAKDRDKPEERFRTIDSNLAFRRLRAQPRAPRRHVVLVSQANKLTARMDDLIYDAETKITVLRDRESVQVMQEASEIHAPKITLLQDKRGSATSLWCEGPGWTKHVNKRTGEHDFTARWKKRLRKFPDPQSDLDIIDIEQDVVLHQPAENSQLQAQFVRIWLDRRQKKSDRNAASNRIATQGTTTGRNERSKRPKLRRLLALDRVTMASPEMRAHTKRLEVWFEYPPQGTSAAASRQISHFGAVSRSHRRSRRSGGAPKSAGFRTSPANSGMAMASVEPPRFGRLEFESETNSPAGSEVNQQPSRKDSVSRDDDRNTVEADRAEDARRRKNDGPLDIWADLIRVRIVREPRGGEPQKDRIGKPRVREVWTLGNVEVRQDHEPGEEPLRINGDKMHILSRAENEELLHIYGRPAHIRDRKMHLEGDSLHLDRGRNKSWVVGKGLLQLPVDRTLDGRELAEPQILDVWWRKSMTFDGLVARFRGHVRSVVEDSRIRCQELDVTMTQRVTFGGRLGQDDAKVRTVVCRDNVQLESYEYEADRLVQIRNGNVKSLSVNQESGETDAKGPGWIAIWRRQPQGRRSRGLGGVAAVRPNRAAARKTNSEWDYTRIDFTDRSRGNLRRRFNRFGSRVEVVYGPVKRPPQVIDADDLPEGGGWMRCKDLVVTQHAKAHGSQPVGLHTKFLTMEASGNAELDGRGFHARADSITFNESQDLYILRSVGRRTATIWRQTKPGGRRSRADAQRMEFIPSRNRLKLDRTKNLDGLR